MRFRTSHTNDMHDELLERLVMEPDSIQPMRIGSGVGVNDVTALSRRFDWDYDLSRLWLTEARWNTLVKQYLDPAALDAWLDLIHTNWVIKKGTPNLAVLRTQKIATQYKGGRSQTGIRRQWSSCMNYVAYRQYPHPEIILDSRTCYVGYLSGLDISFAWHCAQEVARVVNWPVEEMRFQWRIGMAQWDSIKCFGSVVDRVDEVINSGSLAGHLLSGTVKGMRKLDAAGTRYDEEVYATRARLRRNWHREAPDLDYGDAYGDPGRSYAPLLSSGLLFRA